MSENLANFEPYIRYRDLAGLPKGMGPHALSPTGRHIVRFGEVKCRVTVAGVACGQHGGTVAQADNENRPSSAYILAQKTWYAGVMQEHDRRVAAEEAGARARADVAAADAAGIGGLRPILILRGPLADCLFEFDVNERGDRRNGGRHCRNVGIWRL
ncbi:hypothetical protein K458DRAFT_383467 [Lentithecium fluviatile CBS 122367]|uniref:Uncharacterized protein n=1 Tax=Lentithecium fluviatile CBS 122367 TaxID=1168545 RepID=A0A6G1JJL9_9PLEO|nr:hypothetical protein K458DRAFT_383467 [Lentithecium fluviatile CBS 122367]